MIGFAYAVSIRKTLIAVRINFTFLCFIEGSTMFYCRNIEISGNNKASFKIFNQFNHKKQGRGRTG